MLKMADFINGIKLNLLLYSDIFKTKRQLLVPLSMQRSNEGYSWRCWIFVYAVRFFALTQSHIFLKDTFSNEINVFFDFSITVKT